MAPFDRALDAALLDSAASVNHLIGMATFLDDPDELAEYADDAISAVLQAVDSLTQEEAVGALVGVAFEASQSDCEDRLIGAWNVYLEYAGESAHAQMKAATIFHRALEYVVDSCAD